MKKYCISIVLSVCVVGSIVAMNSTDLDEKLCKALKQKELELQVAEFSWQCHFMEKVEKRLNEKWLEKNHKSLLKSLRFCSPEERLALVESRVTSCFKDLQKSLPSILDGCVKMEEEQESSLSKSLKEHLLRVAQSCTVDYIVTNVRCWLLTEIYWLAEEEKGSIGVDSSSGSDSGSKDLTPSEQEFVNKQIELAAAQEQSNAAGDSGV